MNNLCNNKENHNLKDISNISYKEAKNPKKRSEHIQEMAENNQTEGGN